MLTDPDCSKAVAVDGCHDAVYMIQRRITNSCTSKCCVNMKLGERCWTGCGRPWTMRIPYLAARYASSHPCRTESAPPPPQGFCNSTVEDLEKMKLNETGRQKFGRYISPVSRRSIQSYILTDYKLRKRKPLTAQGRVARRRP